MLLNIHSYYSLRYGTLSIEEIVQQTKLMGYHTAVLTDINNTSAAFDFLSQMRNADLNGLLGVSFKNKEQYLYTGIAKNIEGFQKLNLFITQANQTGLPYPIQAPLMNDVWFIYPWGSKDINNLQEYEWIGVSPHELNKIKLLPKKNLHHLVIHYPIVYQADKYHLHQQLRAIDNNILISQLEKSNLAPLAAHFIPQQQLLNYYKEFPMLIQNTEYLLSQCHIDFQFTGNKNKLNFTDNRYEDKELLEKYARQGFLTRYAANNEDALQRLLKELDIIDTLHFSSYFLITDDICRYARHQAFHYVGRGSGANSIVAYCLGITNVCPIELDLYFERFLNPKRASPPDFDIDFSWKDRDDIYSYIMTRYKKENTALMGAMSTFKGKSIIRELGKIYGLPKAEIDRLIHDPRHPLNKNEVTDMILSVHHHLKDFPNQRTIHASGVLISEKPLTYYSALDFPPKGLATTQYDMHVAEAIGFEKFDILSQRGISHIQECEKIILENRKIKINTNNTHSILKDSNVAQQLRTGNTIGCFYIESPAMRQLIRKLNCDNYLTLVAASSIIRPGVASSGMMRTYIERHHYPEKVNYPHPVFKEQLGETYGVMVYQEDVIKIGHHFGGLDLADADVLRRMMSGKYRGKGHLEKIRSKYFTHCALQGYTHEIANEVWRQMESFAGYSFNKAHSASFAIESYQSLYLKTYFPLEFMVAVLNNYGGFYSRKSYIEEARNNGANINLPCINTSTRQTSIQGIEIYLGFDCILNLEDKTVDNIFKNRTDEQPYKTLNDFIQRTSISLEQLVILIRCGALRQLNSSKKQLLWEAHILTNKTIQERKTQYLFEQPPTPLKLPTLEHHYLEDLYDELELLGFPVTKSLFALAKSRFIGDITAKELEQHEGEKIRIVGDFVCDKVVYTKNGELMKFGTFFDAQYEFFDTVHFPASLIQYPLHGAGLYLIEGIIVKEFGCPALEVIRCAKMPLQPDPRSI